MIFSATVAGDLLSSSAKLCGEDQQRLNCRQIIYSAGGQQIAHNEGGKVKLYWRRPRWNSKTDNKWYGTLVLQTLSAVGCNFCQQLGELKGGERKWAIKKNRRKRKERLLHATDYQIFYIEILKQKQCKKLGESESETFSKLLLAEERVKFGFTFSTDVPDHHMFCCQLLCASNRFKSVSTACYCLSLFITQFWFQQRRQSSNQ